MTFRQANREDCRAVYDMICDMEAKSLPYDAFETIFFRQLEDAHYECILGEAAAETVSVVNLRYEEQLHHAGRIAEILEFVVKDGFRDKGLGRELLEHACSRAREQGCGQIEVACNQLRKDTHRFYLREGMKNYHFKFSRDLTGSDDGENVLGR